MSMHIYFTPWTREEQVLEQALKMYQYVHLKDGRNSQKCFTLAGQRRTAGNNNEFVEMVIAKKAAQEQVLNASRAKK